jgi:hypothetical protein
MLSRKYEALKKIEIIDAILSPVGPKRTWFWPAYLVCPKKSGEFPDDVAEKVLTFVI